MQIDPRDLFVAQKHAQGIRQFTPSYIAVHSRESLPARNNDAALPSDDRNESRGDQGDAEVKAWKDARLSEFRSPAEGAA